MIDLDEEYIEGLYDDILTKMIVKTLSNNNISDEEKVKILVEYIEGRGIE